MTDPHALAVLSGADGRPSQVEKAHLVIEHYHRTLDHAARVWDRRNKAFLLLVGVVGIAAILTYSPKFTTWVAELLTKVGTDAPVDLKSADFPITIINAMLLLAVFFLTMNLFQNTATLIRYYKYIGMLESELRSLLGVKDDSMAFARESLHYWNERPRSLWIVRYSYFVIVGALLVFLYALRLKDDIPAALSGAPDVFPLVIDVAVGVPTLFVFFAYVLHSLSNDRRSKFRRT